MYQDSDRIVLFDDRNDSHGKQLSEGVGSVEISCPL
jgi:hypothetical protein